jgi:hypothetical protein
MSADITIGEEQKIDFSKFTKKVEVTNLTDACVTLEVNEIQYYEFWHNVREENHPRQPQLNDKDDAIFVEQDGTVKAFYDGQTKIVMFGIEV